MPRRSLEQLMEPPASAAAAKCACGGRIEPTTNGNGGVVDVCAKCGARPGEGRAPALTLGAACRAKDCPGTLDSAGHCACCVRRAAWLAAQQPKVQCEICEGRFLATRKDQRFCRACGPLAKKVQTRQWWTDNRAKAGASA